MCGNWELSNFEMSFWVHYFLLASSKVEIIDKHQHADTQTYRHKGLWVANFKVLQWFSWPNCLASRLCSRQVVRSESLLTSLGLGWTWLHCEPWCECKLSACAKVNCSSKKLVTDKANICIQADLAVTEVWVGQRERCWWAAEFMVFPYHSQRLTEALHPHSP